MLLKRHTIAGALALSCAGIVASAQTPPPSGTGAPQAPPERRPAIQEPDRPADRQDMTSRVVGCVFRSDDTAARAPNPERPAGPDAFVLADARTTREPAEAAPTGGTPGAVGTSGEAGATYKFAAGDEARLRDLVGKRVEVTGRVATEIKDTPDVPPRGTATAAPERESSQPMPELEIVSIREVPGACAKRDGGR